MVLEEVILHALRAQVRKFVVRTFIFVFYFFFYFLEAWGAGVGLVGSSGGGRGVRERDGGASFSVMGARR